VDEQTLENALGITRAPSAWWWAARGALVLAFGMAAWLGVSLAVAWQLVQRHEPRRAEPVPQVAWGPLESRRHATRDGQEIGSWFVEGPSDGPSVLLLHGHGGNRGKCLDRAAFLAGEGCSVMLISQRAHGDSTGDINDIGFSARHDVITAVEFLERRRPGRPLIVHGTSMGAAAAVFASRELGRRVSGYILESPYRDLRTAVWNRTENALPPVLDRIAYTGLTLVAPLILPQINQIAPVAAIGGVPADVPVLIIAGGLDRKARPSEARALQERVASHARLLLFETAGHLNFPQIDPQRYERSLREFLRSIEEKSRPQLTARTGR
jgi:alpha-beta hydrolase superfamily lysophospholipase